MARVTVGVARERTLTAQMPWVSSIGKHFQPFNGNGDVFKWVKIFSSGTENTKQTKSINPFLLVSWFNEKTHFNPYVFLNIIQLK